MNHCSDESADHDRLVLLACAGDAGAFADLFEHYRDRLGQTVRLRMDHRLRGRLDVADVLQEAFLDASRRLTEYVAAPDVSMYVWLRSLTIQRLVDLHRWHLGAKMRSVSREVSIYPRSDLSVSAESLTWFLIDRAPTPGAEAVGAEMRQRIHATLNSMHPIDCEMLAMRHFEMMSNTEVAQALGLTKAAASNRYVRAIQRLSRLLQGEFDESRP